MTDVTVTIGGQPINVTLPGGDAEAMRQAQLAGAARVAAEAARAGAELALDAAADLVLPANKIIGGTLAGAEAAVPVVGTNFEWVDTATQIAQVRKRTAPGSDLLFSLPTTVGLGAAGGAGQIGTATGGTIANALYYATPAMFPAAGTEFSQAALQAAVNWGVATGAKVTIPSGAYTIPTPMVWGPVNVHFEGTVTLNYTGVTHIHKVLAVAPAGANCSLTGKLVVNANNKANIGVFIANEGATRGDLTVGNLEGRNCRMVAGNAFNDGAVGVVLRGNFDTVLYERLWGENIGRAAGTGDGGVFGCTGATVDTTAGQAARHIAGKIIGGRNITTDDAVGSAARVDCDAAAIFQNDEPDAICSLGSVISVNASGRALKLQTYRGTVVNQVTVWRSTAGITGGTVEIDSQYGDVNIQRADFYYSGNADTVFGSGTSCIATGSGNDRPEGYPISPVLNITINDRCTVGTATINAVAIVTNGSTNALPKMAAIENVIVNGRSVKRLVDIGQNGSAGRGQFVLRIAGVTANITQALIGNSAACPNLHGHVSGVFNTGAAVPAILRSDAVPLGNNFGRIFDGGGNVGIQRYRGTAAQPGLHCDASLGFSQLSIGIGTYPVMTTTLATGVTQDSDVFGSTPGRAVVVMGSPEFGPLGEYTTDGNAITTIRAAAGVVVSSDGTRPVTGDIRVWKIDSGNRFRVELALATDPRPYFIQVTG